MVIQTHMSLKGATNRNDAVAILVEHAIGAWAVLLFADLGHTPVRPLTKPGDSTARLRSCGL